MTDTPIVVASIISTGEGEALRGCLKSLAEQHFAGRLRVVVVCNGVPDESAAIAREIIPDAVIIQNATKRSFSENHNAALRALLWDFGLILNPDVILPESCVQSLVTVMQRHPHAGILGPLLRYPSGAVQPSARRFPRLTGTLIRRTPLRALIPSPVAHARHLLPPPDSDRMVDWLLGACLMVRRAAWEAVEGFDPGFRPLYVEDIDLAWRTWRAGWEVWQTPDAEAMHEHQAATDKAFFHRRTLWHLRGMLRFVRKHPRILISGRRPVRRLPAVPA